ncbi:MAG: helix-turn-helix domain-containing protein [Thermoleophilia bacterium]
MASIPGSLLTLNDCAQRLNVGKRTIERWRAEGRLAVVKVGRVTRVEPAELERFISANRMHSSEPLVTPVYGRGRRLRPGQRLGE